MEILRQPFLVFGVRLDFLGRQLSGRCNTGFSRPRRRGFRPRDSRHESGQLVGRQSSSVFPLCFRERRDCRLAGGFLLGFELGGDTGQAGFLGLGGFEFRLQFRLQFAEFPSSFQLLLSRGLLFGVDRIELGF